MLYFTLEKNEYLINKCEQDMDLEIIAPAQYIKGAATAHYSTCAARAHNSKSTATAGLQHISVYTSLEN